MPNPNRFEIQFLRRSNIMIPGTGGRVAPRGAVMTCGPAGDYPRFPYRSPEEQVEHYGAQEFVLVNAYYFDKKVDHEDEGRFLSPTAGFIVGDQADTVPAGVTPMLAAEMGYQSDATPSIAEKPITKTRSRSKSSGSAPKTRSRARSKKS